MKRLLLSILALALPALAQDPATNATAEKGTASSFRIPGVRIGMTWDEFAAARTNATTTVDGTDRPIRVGEANNRAAEVLDGAFTLAIYSFAEEAGSNVLEEVRLFGSTDFDPEALLRSAVDRLGAPDAKKTIACYGAISDVLVWQDGRTLSVLIVPVEAEFEGADKSEGGCMFYLARDSKQFREGFKALDPSVQGTRTNPYPYLPDLPPAGEVTSYVHCRRGAPWEEIDRKTGDAILSLVSDYRTYRRVHSGEPTFRRAWKEGFVALQAFIKNRGAWPLSFSSDGAWLDIGDGYYYLSVPEEKREALLKLLEPFERQTIPEKESVATFGSCPAAPSPAEEKHAESAEPGGGSGEAQPPPVESHAESAEGAE